MALPPAPYALTTPGLLPLLGAALGRIVYDAVQLLTIGARHAGGPQRALLAVLVSGPIELEPDPVGPGIVLAKREHLAGLAA